MKKNLQIGIFFYEKHIFQEIGEALGYLLICSMILYSFPRFLSTSLGVMMHVECECFLSHTFSYFSFLIALNIIFSTRGSFSNNLIFFHLTSFWVLSASDCGWHEVGACNYTVSSWGSRETCRDRRWIGGPTFWWSLLVQVPSNCPCLDTLYPLSKCFRDSILFLDIGKLKLLYYAFIQLTSLFLILVVFVLLSPL